MVTVKKNKTVQWLKSLPNEQQEKLTIFAMQERSEVSQAHKKEDRDIWQKRQELMVQAKRRRDLLEQKAQMERERLSTVHVISSVAELDQVFADIDDSGESASKNCKKKLAILKE